MKKLTLVGLVMILMLACIMPLTAAGTAEESSGTVAPAFKKTTLRFGTTSAESTLVVATMRAFAEKVLERTDDQVVVQIFPASQLGDAAEIVKSAQMGAVDICMAQPASIAGMGVKPMSVLSLPYIFKSFDQRLNVLYGDVGQGLLDEISNGKINLRGFGYFPDGARSFFTAEGKPIRKFEDVKGMKLRVQPYDLDTDMVLAMGASPTPTAFAELYSALQSGVVDGGEQPIAGFYGNKLYEVSGYFTLDEHTYNTLVILFSEISWNKLSPELQTLLTQAWKESVTEFKDKIIANEKDLLDEIAATGTEIIELQDREKWMAAMDPIYAKYGVGVESWIEKIRSVE